MGSCAMSQAGVACDSSREMTAVNDPKSKDDALIDERVELDLVALYEKYFHQSSESDDNGERNGRSSWVSEAYQDRLIVR